MKRPARLPATPDDLAEWTVYGDWLQGEGDLRGKAIALELAGATTDNIRNYAGIDAVMRFGYIHTLIVPRDVSSVTADTIARAQALVASDDAALLEELEIPLEPELVDNMRRVFAALPVTCRRVAIHLCSPISDDAARALLAAVPGHIREVGLSSNGVRLSLVGITGLARWIDDRFDAVEVRYARSTWSVALQHMDFDRSVIAKRVAETSRVRVRLTMADAPYLLRRVDIGGPDDAALVDLDRRCVMALSTRASHRRADGSIRSRFEVVLYPAFERIVTSNDSAHIVFSRDGDDWWVERGSSVHEAPVWVNGVEFVANAAMAIEGGARISSSGHTYVLVTREVTPTVRALLA